ncbi:MAG: hypothetical protein HUJ90_08145, partial [Bacteroidales bacterium]|nr:hypothetical protein [Bacteroidales bacterium]
MDDKKSALFFSSDIYNFFKDESVYFFPATSNNGTEASVKGISSKVQRTAVISALQKYKKGKVSNLQQAFENADTEIENHLDKNENSKNNPLIIVSYKEAVEEKVLKNKTTADNVIQLKKGDSINYDFLKEILFSYNFR